MISVANDFNFNIKPASVYPPLFVFETPYGGPRVSPELDPPERRGERDRSGPEAPKSTACGGGYAVAGAGNEHPAAAPDELELPHKAPDSSRAAGNRMRGFKIGDMVWGKVESHPWWPGQIYNEAFVPPSVLTTKVEGHVLVTFFGDSSYGWFDPAELVPFEPHFPDKSRQTNSHNFLNAVEEAVDEASRRGALALACHCRSPANFRPTGVPGYVTVDVSGYEPGGIYSTEQIEKARESFSPVEALSFVRQMAVMPGMEPRSVNWIKSKAMLLAYWRAMFGEFDKANPQAFGKHPVQPSQDASGLSDQPDKSAIRGLMYMCALIVPGFSPFRTNVEV